jgi:hypothetical protein
LKTGLVQNAWKVWGLKSLWKPYGSGFAEIRSGNRRPCPESWTYRPNQVVPHQGRSTHESAPPAKGTPPYSCFEGNPTDKSKTSPPMARRERARNILFTDENIFTIEEQYNNQCNKIYAQKSLEVRSEGAGGHHPSYVMVWRGCPIRGWHLFIFARKVWKLVPECIKRMFYKEFWNFLTRLSSVVRNGSSSRTQLLPTRPRRLRSDPRGTFQPLSALRIGARGVQTSTPWTINGGLFWRTWLPEIATTTWTAWRDPPWRQRQRSPLETVRAAIAEWSERLKTCVEAEGGHFEWHYYKYKLKTITNKLFGSKSGCSVSFSFLVTHTCNIT